MSRRKARSAKERKALREAAAAAIAALSDEELNNLRHEIGREISLQANVINDLRLRLEAVRREVEHRKTVEPETGIHITDHAVVRYLERYKGLNVVGVRKEIVVLAERAKVLGIGRNGRRKDDETNLVIGFDGEANHVTTVFNDAELPVMKILNQS